MPQLNPEFYVSQLFWLFVTFSFLLVFLWRISLPRIGTVLKKRERKINDDIAEAKKLQIEAENIQKNIDEKLKNAQNEVSALLKKSSKEYELKSEESLKKLDDKLTKKIEESAKEIEQNKNNSLDQVQTQIKEISKISISKITNFKISDDEINEALSNQKDLN